MYRYHITVTRLDEDENYPPPSQKIVQMRINGLPARQYHLFHNADWLIVCCYLSIRTHVLYTHGCTISVDSNR